MITATRPDTIAATPETAAAPVLPDEYIVVPTAAAARDAAEPVPPESAAQQPQTAKAPQYPPSWTRARELGLHVEQMRAISRKVEYDRRNRKIVPDLVRDLKHGWLLENYLIPTDDLLWGRWAYLDYIARFERLPKEPIPQILFEPANDIAAKMLLKCLDSIHNYGGSWMGFSSWNTLNYFFDWLLFALGHGGNKTLPREPEGCEGASMRLYQLFNLDLMQLYPADYWGEILAENKHGRALGFYPTPINICDMMATMLFGPKEEGEDTRMKTVMDPAVGTGPMLLASSNHSLCLYGQDIDLTCVKACLINGYIYAPWMVRPVRAFFPDYCDPSKSPEIAVYIASLRKGDPSGYWDDLEHDPLHQEECEPIKKCRKIHEPDPGSDEKYNHNIVVGDTLATMPKTERKIPEDARAGNKKTVQKSGQRAGRRQ